MPDIFKIQKVNMQKYLSLMAGILGVIMSGMLYSFNTYAIALKNTFNYTQIEVEYIASSADIGQCFMIPAGFVFDRFGPRPSCILSLIFTGVGFIVLWMTTMFHTFFVANAWMQVLIYFVTLFGTSFLYLTSIGVNSKNFEGKQRVWVQVILGCVFGIAPALFSAIYQGLFVQGHIRDAENQKYGDYMLFLAVLSVIINLLCIVFLKEIPAKETFKTDESDLNELFKSFEQDRVMEETDDSIDDKHFNEKDELIANANCKDSTACSLDLNFWQMIQTLQFYYLFLIIMILGGIGVTFMNNIAIVLKSVHREYDIAVFTICLPIFGSLGKIVVTLMTNYILLKWDNIPKSIYPLPCSLLMCFGLIVIIFSNQGFFGLFISTILTGLSYGALYVQIQCLSIELFGIKYFGQNYGVLVFAQTIGMFGFQQLFGFSYKLNSPPGSNECFGQFCFKWTFVLLAILCFCALFLNICLIKIERDASMKRKESKQIYNSMSNISE